MTDYQIVKRKEAELEQTVNLKKLIGKRVLSDGGAIVGYISEVRINSEGFGLEGIVVSGREGQMYIGKSYFSTLSDYSVILNTDISLLLKRRKVITVDGKVIGRVKEVNRKGTTNEIESLIVQSFWKKYLIPVGEIKQIGNPILIKERYIETKNYLWTRPKQDAHV